MIFSALFIKYLLSTYSVIVLGICEWIIHVILSLKSEEYNGKKIILLVIHATVEVYAECRSDTH